MRGRVGHPRRRPDFLFADRGYDHDAYRDQVRARGIVPAIARRGTLNGTGLGTYRWVVERTIAWLHGFRRLRIRWERRADIHEAFLTLAWGRLERMPPLANRSDSWPPSLPFANTHFVRISRRPLSPDPVGT